MSALPNLEPRFLPPPGWQWRFVERDEYRLRYGFAAPETGSIHGVIVMLPGLSEFCEKYFELAHDALARGYAFLVLDWNGQGLSSRYFANRHKRHSHGFERDAADLHTVLADCALWQPDIMATTPLYALAHSMGGLIGLIYMQRFEGIFSRAAFCAPMWGVKMFSTLGDHVVWPLVWTLNFFASKAYAPLGGAWSPEERDTHSHTLFSSDPIRAGLHNTWMRHDKDLQIGHVTNTWIYEAYQCTQELKNVSFKKESLNNPLVFIAGNESFVCNHTIQNLIPRISDMGVQYIPGALHELLMEKNEIRLSCLDKIFTHFTVL